MHNFNSGQLTSVHVYEHTYTVFSGRRKGRKERRKERRKKERREGGELMREGFKKKEKADDRACRIK